MMYHIATTQNVTDRQTTDGQNIVPLLSTTVLPYYQVRSAKNVLGQ